MKIYLATWVSEKAQGQSLTRIGMKKRLVSYHSLIDQNIITKQFVKYIQTGKNLLKKKKS